MSSPVPIEIREVLPRDGFQDLDRHLPAATKIAVTRRLWDAGLRWIEVTSMVSPKWVPQFADAEEVLRAARGLDGLKASVFVANRRGLERALAVGADEVSLALASTDTLSQKNFNMDREEALAELGAVAATAREAGAEVSLTIGGALGCPYEGEVAPADVAALAARAVALEPASLFVADTIGVGTPAAVGAVVRAVREAAPGPKLGVHLHGGDASTESVLVAIGEGATVVDSALAGFGGCPFVPDAPGNVSTEAVSRALDAAGLSHAEDSGALLAAAAEVRSMIDAVPVEAA
jgi:hydroxymethylglutaryl-CoA lyase